MLKNTFLKQLIPYFNSTLKYSFIKRVYQKIRYYAMKVWVINILIIKNFVGVMPSFLFDKFNFLVDFLLFKILLYFLNV